VAEAVAPVRYVFVGETDSLEAAMEAVRGGAVATDKAVKQVGETSDKAFKKGAKRAELYKGALKKTAAAAVAVAAGVVLAAKKVVDYSAKADGLLKTSEALGSNVEEVQALQGALGDLAGAEDLAAAAAASLNNRLGEAKQGGGEAKAALDALGLSAEELDKLPLEVKFATIADALQQYSSDADRARLLNQLLEESGAALKPAFDKGGDAILEAAMRTRQAGVISQEAAEAAAVLQGQVAFATRAVEALVDGALSRAVPDLGEFAGAVEAAARAAQSSDGFQTLIANISDVTIGALRATAALIGLDVEMGLPEAQRLGKRIGELQGELGGLQELLELTADLTTENAETFLSATASLGVYGSISDRVSEIVVRMNDAQLELDETEARSIERTKELIAQRQAALEVANDTTRGTRTLAAAVDEANKAASQTALGDMFDGVLEAVNDLQTAPSELGELLDFFDQLSERAAESAEKTRDAYRSIVEEAAAATTQLTQLVLDAVTREVRETQQEIRELERGITQARSAGAKQRLRIEKETKEKELEEQKKAATAAWVLHQVAAIAQATVSMALGIANSLAMGGPTGIAFAVASGIAGAAAIAAIAATPPPSFHSGGLNMVNGAAGMGPSTPDSRLIRARDGEFINNNNGVRALGLKRLQEANRTGRDGGGRVEANFFINDRLVDHSVQSSTKRRGSSLEEAFRADDEGRGRNPRAA